MKIFIEETATGNKIEAQILPASKRGMPLKKDGWQFNWRELARENEEAMFFKLVIDDCSDEIEGMLMLLIENDEMLTMKNIELAPLNLGSKGKYDLVAGCLIAFACHESLNLGKDNYRGFLSFESKTKLISLYQTKYGATQALGQRMFIDAISGKKLIKKFLAFDID